VPETLKRIYGSYQIGVPNVRAIAANFVAKEMSMKLWKVALIRLANIVFSVDCGTVQVRCGFSLR
jgi:hypothetical protein